MMVSMSADCRSRKVHRPRHIGRRRRGSVIGWRCGWMGSRSKAQPRRHWTKICQILSAGMGLECWRKCLVNLAGGVVWLCRPSQLQKSRVHAPRSN